MGKQISTDNNSNNDSKKVWSTDEQDKIDAALRQADLEEEIERKLREKRWSVSNKNN